MHLRSILRPLAVFALLIGAACGGDGDESGGGGGGGEDAGLSADEQAFADAWASGLSDDDDGFSASAGEGACMGEAIMAELGLDPFEEAGITPADVEDESESPGELLGAGVISDEQANSILDTWEDCVDLSTLFAESVVDDFDLDAEAVACVADGLDADDLARGVFLSSFVSDDPEPDADVIGRFLAVIDDCSTSDDGEGGFLVDGIAESIQEDSDLTEAQARCVAQEMVEIIGLDRFIELGAQDLDFDDADPALQQEIAGAVLEAAGTCDVPLSEL